jgi:hypothetical protein
MNPSLFSGKDKTARKTVKKGLISNQNNQEFEPNYWVQSVNLTKFDRGFFMKNISIIINNNIQQFPEFNFQFT